MSVLNLDREIHTIKCQDTYSAHHRGGGGGQMDKNSTFQNEISVYKEEIKYQINILISKGLIDFILLQYN